MRFCTNCGSKLTEGVDVCSSCGQPVHYSGAEVTPDQATDSTWNAADASQGSSTAAADQGSSSNATSGTYTSQESTSAYQHTSYQANPSSGSYGQQGGSQGSYQQGGSQGSYQQAGPQGNYQQGYQQGGNYQYNQAPPPSGPVMGRNVAVAIILSIVTCGIFSLVWLYQLENDSAILSGEEPKGGMVILLTIITCGLYLIYWWYVVGNKRTTRINGKDNGVLFLILSILQLDIVNMAIMQGDINEAVGYNSL